jgi:hypothetical protein
MAAATTSVNGYLTSTDWTTFNGKQAALVSGTNIKTVNGTTLLGSGDVGTITYAYGGTGQTTVTTGDVLYGSATNTWSKLGIGTTGQILRVVSGTPAWGTDYVGTVTSVGGTGTVNGITLTGTVTSSGNLTLGGTLGSIANSQLSNSAVTIGSTSISLGATSTTLAGLTGVTSSAITDSGLTSGRVTYATTGGLLTDSANLTFNGTTLTANTIGAFTLGGTVAGGGNQLNNVIIGTTTPLAGAFTTLSATGTLNGGTSGTGYSFSGSAPATSLTLDSSGNLGLGVTPSAWSLGKTLQIGATTAICNDGSANTYYGNNFYYNAGFKYLSTNPATYYIQGSGTHSWYTAPSGTAGNAITFTQAMTLDASGNLLVGKTSSGQVLTNGFEYNNGGTYLSICSSTAGNTPGYFANTAGSGTRYLIRFYGTSSEVGKITHDGSNTTYATSSDYRLKENIAPMTGALNKVLQLKPCIYTWKSNNATGQGFIAHELQEVCPQAVVGEKDAIDKDGKPDYQGIDTSFLVATLTSAIQELSAQVTTLTTRLTTLENK